MKSFACISQIDLEKERSWREPFFLTIDIDWAPDYMIEDLINLIENSDICATWFITHDTTLLNRLRSNKKFELGIHPNFNQLLNCDASNGSSAEKVILKLLEIVPEAKSVRSHSMTQSSGILNLFAKHSLQFDCNTFIPGNSGIDIKPWNFWNGNLTQVPYCWEDDIFFTDESQLTIEETKALSGLKVFDFHPVHTYLNTESLERYQRYKVGTLGKEKVLEMRYSGVGSRTRLKNLISAKCS